MGGNRIKAPTWSRETGPAATRTGWGVERVGGRGGSNDGVFEHSCGPDASIS